MVVEHICQTNLWKDRAQQIEVLLGNNSFAVMQWHVDIYLEVGVLPNPEWDTTFR